MAKGYIENLLGDQEKIILVTRQHWFVVLGSIFVEIVAIISIIVLIILVNVVFPTMLGESLDLITKIITVVGIFLLLLPFATMTYDIMVWWNQQYIVTNRRVMQISGIFNKSVIDSSLEKVNDVKLTQSVLGRLFGYGDVEILTASELGVNLFKRIEDPIRFKTAMINSKEKIDHGDSTDKVDELTVPDAIEQLDKLRQQGILTEEEFQQKKADLLGKM